jgi:hypothetical protein
MVNYRIIPSEFSHIGRLCGSLRYDDLAEISCFGLRPFTAVSRSYKLSYYRRSAVVDGELAAMWGLSGVMFGTGQYWLLTGKAIERIPVAFVKESLREIEVMLQMCSRIEGVVTTAYSKAVRLLEVLGFSLSPPFEVRGISVQRYWIEN